MKCCIFTNQTLEQIIPQIHDNDGDENRKHTGMILIDLQNAFGTLDQKI